ncbi:molybdopterin-dependent oxidoreductase [Rhodococcus sp. NPDC059968]|uniref:molybdopterin-containing oxidoreductase family protein n=1 Tax=Rhodococcus sp. NPDC059968 TaxID=3347017 RepID=UPI00366D919E
MTTPNPVTVLSSCHHDCPDTCSILVTVEDGVATHVRGNPAHPFTRGGLCPKVNDFEKRVYHDERVLYPLRRVGPKGQGEFERISWDEAIETICEKFRQIRDEFGAEAILPTGYLGNQHLVNGLNVMDPFMHRLGASICERTFCTSTRGNAFVLTNGTAVTDPEAIVHAKYIIVWGHNPMSSHIHLMPFILKARKNGAKLVVIDPYRSRTAKKADWHIKIKPGTDGALALGMMNVIISEGLTDDDYIANYTTGFEELRASAAEFTPERVADITEVPADDIRTLAREYASTQPSSIRVGTALENHAQGGQAFRAVYSLPALVGAWRYPGGGTHDLTLFAFPVRWAELSQTQWIRPGTQTVNITKLGRALTGDLELRTPIQALMVCNGNPFITAPEQNKVAQGLQRDDLFTVVADHFITDTARYADIVLPATTILEHFDLAFSWGHTYVGINMPSIAPRGEAVPNSEIFRRLAAGMGFDDPWFKLTDEEIAFESLDWDAPQLQGITLEKLKEIGFARLAIPGPDEAPYAHGNFPTPSGKVELRIVGVTDSVAEVFRQGYEEGQGDTPIPEVPTYHDEPGDSAHPLRMVTPRGHSFISSQYANIERQSTAEGEQHIQIHPEEAKRRGITDGQRVRVFNQHGCFEAQAIINSDLHQSTIVAPYGYWAMKSRGTSTVNAVTSSDYNDLGRAPQYQHALVEVQPLPMTAETPDSGI